MNDFHIALTIKCAKYLAYSHDNDWAVGGGIFQTENESPLSTVHFTFRTEAQLDRFIKDAKEKLRQWREKT